MDETPKPDRFQFRLWTLLMAVTLTGLWLPWRGQPLVLLAVLCVAFFGYLWYSARVLPEQMASHYSWQREPDAWMSRRAYLALMAVVGAVIPLSSLLVLLMPGPEGERIARLAAWFACLLMALVLGMHVLAVEANRQKNPTFPRKAWWLIGLYFVGVLVWLVALKIGW